MLDALEALAALDDCGTMTAAARRLRLGQSAVSKRLATLAAQLGQPLVEPDGRHVRLTPFARQLLSRARPLLADLQAALGEAASAGAGAVRLAVSESILASWGAVALAGVRRAQPTLELQLATHRSPAAVDGVRAGRYELALVAGMERPGRGVRSRHLLDEPMALISKGSRAPELTGSLPVLTIEPASASWSTLAPRLAALRRASGLELEVTETLQSFPAVVALARRGYAHALAPAPLAKAMGVPARRVLPLPDPGLARPIHLVSRKRSAERRAIRDLVEALVTELPPELSAAVS